MRLDRLRLDVLTADPASPTDGQVWVRDDLRELRIRDGSTTRIVGRRDNLSASASPTANDDIGDDYQVGSIWIDTTNRAVWICVDNTSANAVWVPHGVTVLSSTDAGGANLTTTYASQDSITPGFAGTFKVVATCWCEQSNASDSVFVGLQVNGGTTVIAASEREWARGGNPANSEGSLMTLAEMTTTSGTDSLDFMTRETANAGLVHNITMIAELVSA